MSLGDKEKQDGRVGAWRTRVIRASPVQIPPAEVQWVAEWGSALACRPRDTQVSALSQRQAGWVPHRRTGPESHTGASPGARQDCVECAPEPAVRLPPGPVGLLVPHLHPKVPGGHPHPRLGLELSGPSRLPSLHKGQRVLGVFCFGIQACRCGFHDHESVSDFSHAL